MKNRFLRNFLLFFIGIVWMIFSFFFLSYLIFHHSPSYSSFSGESSWEQAIGLPIRLIITKLNIDVTLQYVGLTREGAMDVPKDILAAARFAPGTRPGMIGSAVVDGHFGLQQGVPAIFDGLSTLRQGDEVTIEDDKGNIISFVVRELAVYEPLADATKVFVSHDGKAHLNLITCGWVWDQTQRTYSHRLVVYTDKK